MTTEYTRLPTGRVVLTGLLELFESVEQQGHAITLDAAGEVLVTGAERLPDEVLYVLQSSATTVSDWLASRGR